MMSIKKVIIVIICVVLIDQLSKFYIKTHFQLNEDYQIFTWFKIAFVENDGMAWGAKISDLFTVISDRTAKIMLTIFRIFALIGIGFWLLKMVKNKAYNTIVIAVALIFAGALGNIIDSVFYGVLFSESAYQVAGFLPESGGYDKLFYGKVVDMLYFPIWSGVLPEWIPFVGGNFFSFFEPVFNIADVSISLGFVIIILFNKKFFGIKQV